MSEFESATNVRVRPSVAAEDYDALRAERDTLRVENAKLVGDIARLPGEPGDHLAAQAKRYWRQRFLKDFDAARVERDQLRAERDAQWISAETLPACPDAEINFEVKDYLVTDGRTVGICDFQRGHGGGNPWAAWGNYGHLRPSEITHWMPLPSPPTPQGEQP